MRKQLKERIFQTIEYLSPEAIECSDYLADHPELSGAEYNSSKKIVNILKKYGFKVEMPFSGIQTAFKGSLKGEGKIKIAFLLEYDALPGIGHACGHCVSGSISILAGLGFAINKDALLGELDLIGTPAEETNGAKVNMLKKGVFDNYDLVIMIHMANRNNIHSQLLVMDALEFTYIGKYSHAAAAPWEGRNALNGLQLMFHAIDMLRQHILPEARIHGVIIKGGEAPNIVPAKAVARFYVRATNRSYLDHLVEKVKDCARGAALATQTEVEIKYFENSFSEIMPNIAGELLLTQIYKELGLKIDKEVAKIGSSDIGNVSKRCHVLHPTLAITEPGVELHTLEFSAEVKGEKAHQAIINGAKVLALAALKVFNDEVLQKKIIKDFNFERTKIV